MVLILGFNEAEVINKIASKARGCCIQVKNPGGGREDDWWKTSLTNTCVSRSKIDEDEGHKSLWNESRSLIDYKVREANGNDTDGFTEAPKAIEVKVRREKLYPRSRKRSTCFYDGNHREAKVKLLHISHGELTIKRATTICADWKNGCHNTRSSIRHAITGHIA